MSHATKPQPNSRAAAAAQRRISASAARKQTNCEVLLLTSKSFPSQQYQQLLNFIKGLQLPPDVSSLFTTVRNERVAERKALLSSQSQEDVDSVLKLYGSRFALLAQATQDLGLSQSRDSLLHPASPDGLELPAPQTPPPAASPQPQPPPPSQQQQQASAAAEQKEKQQQSSSWFGSWQSQTPQASVPRPLQPADPAS